MSSKPIVVGYDGSPGAGLALEFTIGAARPQSLTIDVVHSWLPPLPAFEFAAGYLGPRHSEFNKAAERVLDEALDSVRAAGPYAVIGGDVRPFPIQASELTVRL